MKTKLIGLTLLFLILTVSVKAIDKKITTSNGVELFVTIKGEGIPCLYLFGSAGSKPLREPANKDYSLNRMLRILKK